MADQNAGKSGVDVLVLANFEDEVTVKRLLSGVQVKQEVELRLEYSFEGKPGCRECQNLEEQIKRSDKCLLILSDHSNKDEWIRFCQDVIGAVRPIIPFIIDQTPAEKLCNSIRPYICIRVGEEWEKKLLMALECKDNRFSSLPMASIAPGLCSNYFFGFLNIVMPDFLVKVKEWKRRKVETQQEIGRRINVINHMLILVPNSCKCKRNIQEYCYKESNYSIQKEKDPVKCSRTDYDPDRSYDQSMYRVTQKGGEDYYIVLVMCSTMQTLCEMEQDYASGISKHVMMREREQFVFALEKMLRDKSDCFDNVEVLSFDDEKEDLPKLVYDCCKKTDIVAE